MAPARRAHTGRIVAARRRGRGQGRYGSAQADLSALLRQLPAGGLASLALSTRASFLRQLGGHRAARGWDGRALALAGTDGASTVEPAVDALVGLAADALGVGRLAARPPCWSGPTPNWRVSTSRRRGWRSGGPGWVPNWRWRPATACGPRRRPNAASSLPNGPCRAAPAPREERRGARRGTLQRGAIDRAREVADRALTETATYGLVPLRWALACLLSDLGSATRATHEVVTIREQCAAEVTRRGGRWSGG